MNICHNEATSRRSFLQGAISMGLASKLSAMPREANSVASALPNIVYIHSHDSGRYLGPYGYAVPTPNLIRLAKEGVLFRNAFCAAPTCSPSRASLLTGQCAHKNGMLGLVNCGFVMGEYERTIIRFLNNAGYTTVLAGLQHIAPRVEMIGYTQVLPHKSVDAVDVAAATVDYLRSYPKGPFFLDVGFFQTHRNYGRHSRDGKMYESQPTGYTQHLPLDNPNYVIPPATLPDTPQTREDFAGFHASARAMDEGVGQVLTVLENYGYADNTLVLSTTDHGIAFPTMKCCLDDNGMGVSLIMRGPGVFQGGKVCDAMVSHLDIFPTLCEYLKIEPPAWLEGTSFLPVLRGETKEIREEIFAEVNYHAAYEPKRAVRTVRWKYIRHYNGRKTPVLSNCDEGLSKTFWLSYGWKDNPLEHEEQLYDLIFDPTEHNNLAGDPAHRAVLEDMRKRLDGWMRRTNDPLLRGPVPLPAGAHASPVDTVHELCSCNFCGEVKNNNKAAKPV